MVCGGAQFEQRISCWVTTWVTAVELVPASGPQTWGYARQALSACCDKLVTAREGERNNRLNGAAFHMGRMIARDWISEQEVTAALHRASEANGLAAEDAKRAEAERKAIVDAQNIVSVCTGGSIRIK